MQTEKFLQISHTHEPDNVHLNELRDIALSNGGKLISTQWLGTKHKYEFEFSDGRKFKMNPNNIKSHQWPKNPDDYYRVTKRTNEENYTLLKELAHNNGGSLLSKEWRGVKHKYDFEFKDGRFFSMAADSMRRYGWPQNPDNYFKAIANQSGEKIQGPENIYLQELNRIAQMNGGKLLSKEWRGNAEKYEFMDSNGSIFQLRINSLRLGGWNPNRGLVSEPLCTQAMNHLFHRQHDNGFSKNRHVLSMDVTKGKNAWELDGYCEELKIAFEYQGHASHWDLSHKKFNDVHTRDTLKKEYCKNLGVVLVVIPPFVDKTNKWHSDTIIEHVRLAIKASYEELKIHLPDLNERAFKTDFSTINHSINMLNTLEEIAKKNNGKLLSKEWLGNNTRYDFEFSNGQTFQMMAKNLKQKGWPQNPEKYFNNPTVYKNKKTPEENYARLKNLAHTNGGKLLSEKWLGYDKNHQFTYHDGKDFLMRPKILFKSGWPKNLNSFMSKSSIPKKDFLNELKKLAKASDITLLSETWLGVHEKHLFRRPDGKHFEATPHYIKAKGWPGSADKINKKTPEALYESLQAIASLNKGRVITEKWLGSHQKHHFAFEDGREFHMLASSILKARWPKNPELYFKLLNGKKKCFLDIQVVAQETFIANNSKKHTP